MANGNTKTIFGTVFNKKIVVTALLAPLTAYLWFS